MTIEILRLRKERERKVKDGIGETKVREKNCRFRGKRKEKGDDKRRKERYKCDGFGSLEIVNFLRIKMKIFSCIRYPKEFL